MKKLWALFQHRIVWTSGVALLAIVAVPAILILVLKALGLVHGTSLHTWLLDVGQGVDADAAAAAAAAAAAGGAGSGQGPPNPYTGFLFLWPRGVQTSVSYSQPSTNSPVNGQPAAGVRTAYNNVVFGPNGNPTWYHCFGAANGWVEASQTSTQRPPVLPISQPTHPVEGEVVSATSSSTAGIRG